MQGFRFRLDGKPGTTCIVFDSVGIGRPEGSQSIEVETHRGRFGSTALALHWPVENRPRPRSQTVEHIAHTALRHAGVPHDTRDARPDAAAVIVSVPGQP